MKILLGYPPCGVQKGTPLLSQNRQFQYFNAPTYIYPVVPASAATLLKQAGYEVIWLDAIAQGLTLAEFLEIVKKEKPDLIAFETKTPVIKEHWRIINLLKGLSTIDYRLSTVLFGDHVTALPEEAFQNSQVDFVLTGGDYDFLLLNLCNYLNARRTTLQLCSGQAHDARRNLETGIYYRQDNQVKNTGKFRLDHDLNSLPLIDRDLTRWRLYAYHNGNYKRTPGTYIMSGRDCWWGRCSFCSWPTLYPEFRARKTGNVLDEVSMLVEKYNIREIMDDTGTFPVGDWLKDFCHGIVARGLGERVYLDANMRFGALSAEDFTLMKKANFRLLLFGLESGNQSTLDRLNKNLKVERIIADCRAATKAGLFPHITIMFGYPWEDYADALMTLRLGRWLLNKGYAYTMQATIAIPYPGTPLFRECEKNGWLKSLDWEDYDMKRPVMLSPIPDQKIAELVQGMYKISFSPEFIFRKVFSLRDADDLRYSLRAAKKVFGHIFDFAKAR